MSGVNRSDGNEEGAGTSSAAERMIKSILKVRRASTRDWGQRQSELVASDSPLAPTSGAIKWLLDVLDQAVTSDEQREKVGRVKVQLHNILRTLSLFEGAVDQLNKCYSMIREKRVKEKALEEKVASLTDRVRELEENDRDMEFFVEQFSSEHGKRMKAEDELEEVKKQLELLQRQPTAAAPVGEDEDMNPDLPIVPLSSILEIIGADEGQINQVSEASPVVPAADQLVVERDSVRLVLVEPPPPNEIEIEGVGQPERREHGNRQLDILRPVVILDKYVPPEGSGENSMSENVSDQDPPAIVAGPNDSTPPPTRNPKKGYYLRRRANRASATTGQSSSASILKSKKVVRQSATTSTSVSGGKTGNGALSKVGPALRVEANKSSAGNCSSVSEKPFVCGDCGSSFRKPAHLRRHNYIHQPESKPFACTGYGLCGKRFYDRSALRMHIRSHTGDRPYPCSECDQKFASKHGWKSHERTHDRNRTRDFACDLCPRKCYTNGDLIQHKKIHLTVRAFQCDICNRAFKTQAELKKHKVAHSSERKFRCRYCKLRFKRSGQLIQHEYWHQGITNYPCDECEMRFSRNSHLVQHKRRHTGEKPHKCHFCDRAFHQTSSRRNHERRSHPDQVQG